MIGLYDILQAANGQLFGEPAAHLFTDFCLDPQQAGESLLYVALKTDQGDTHRHIEHAINNGVSGVLCVDPPAVDTTGVSVLLVRDPVEALMAWTRNTLGKLGLKSIAVAGSSGKSVTVETITHVVGTQHKVHQSNIDINGRLSIPLSLPNLRAGHEYVVFKLAATHPGEMAEMVQAVQPDIGVVTNVDCIHDAAFADCDQLLEEYSVLLDYLSPSGLALLNYDDDRSRDLLSRTRAQLQTVGIDRFGADWMAFNILNGLTGTGFDLRRQDRRFVGRWSPLLGKFHLYGILCAVAIGEFVGIDVDTALDALTDLSPMAGRMNPLSGQSRCLLVDDTYRANPISTLGALDWLKNVQTESQRTIFVFGDLDNIGKNTVVGHRMIGRKAAEVADIIITQGPGAAHAGRSAIDQGMKPDHVLTSYSSQDTVYALSQLNLNENDIVLVKGGANQRLEQVIDALIAERDQDRLLSRSHEAVDRITSFRPMLPSWVEISSSAITANLDFIRQQIDEDTALMAVVKANGYGHGAVTVAQTALLSGVEHLAVASMAEALALRNAGIDAPILVLSYTPVQAVRQAVLQQITVNLYDLDMAYAYDRLSREIEGSLKLKVHVKVDSGMGRLGVLADDAVTLLRHIAAMEHLELEGIYTHFATADEDVDYAYKQVETFREVIREARSAGIRFKYIHAANSAGILAIPDSYFNLVRSGIMLYGLSPTNTMNEPEGLQPAMTWKTTVAQVRHLPANYPIGYGNTYFTQSEETIAILPVGYADGLRRSPNPWREVLVHGQRAPIIGRISMEKCAINVTHIPDVSIGDEVVLLGHQGDEQITAEEIAQWLDTINYEVVTTILPRVPRQ